MCGRSRHAPRRMPALVNLLGVTRDHASPARAVRPPKGSRHTRPCSSADDWRGPIRAIVTFLSLLTLSKTEHI